MGLVNVLSGCWVGAGWVQWMDICSEVPKPRLFDPMHRNAFDEE